MALTTNHIVAIIPARGGSKRIPKKNIRLLAGKPLIAHTIEAAQKSKYIDHIVVSTDDEEVAEVSKKHGASVLSRPKQLAGDTAKTIGAVLHAIATLAKDHKKPEVVVLLQPTSPLRNHRDIDRAVELFLQHKQKPVVGVCESDTSVYWALVGRGPHVESAFGWKKLEKRSQDLPKTYLPNGAVFVTAAKDLQKYKSFYFKKVVPYIMPKERSKDIDEEEDFLAVEKMLNDISIS